MRCRMLGLIILCGLCCSNATYPDQMPVTVTIGSSSGPTLIPVGSHLPTIDVTISSSQPVSVADYSLNLVLVRDIANPYKQVLEFAASQDGFTNDQKYIFYKLSGDYQSDFPATTVDPSGSQVDSSKIFLPYQRISGGDIAFDGNEYSSVTVSTPGYLLARLTLSLDTGAPPAVGDVFHIEGFSYTDNSGEASVSNTNAFHDESGNLLGFKFIGGDIKFTAPVPSVVPEPSATLLMGLGGLLLAAGFRCFRRA